MSSRRRSSESRVIGGLGFEALALEAIEPRRVPKPRGVRGFASLAGIGGRRTIPSYSNGGAGAPIPTSARDAEADAGQTKELDVRRAAVAVEPRGAFVGEERFYSVAPIPHGDVPSPLLATLATFRSLADGNYGNWRTRKGATQSAERAYTAVFEEALAINNLKSDQANSQSPKDFRLHVNGEAIEVELKKFDSGGSILCNDTLPVDAVYYLIINTREERVVLVTGAEIKDWDWRIGKAPGGYNVANRSQFHREMTEYEALMKPMKGEWAASNADHIYSNHPRFGPSPFDVRIFFSPNIYFVATENGFRTTNNPYRGDDQQAKRRTFATESDAVAYARELYSFAYFVYQRGRGASPSRVGA